MPLSLKNSERVRDSLSVKEKRKIKKMYSDLANQIKEEAKKIKGREMSAVSRRTYLNNLERQLRVEVDKISSEIKMDIESNMLNIAQAVVEDNSNWLTKIGVTLRGAYSYVPKEVVNSIVTGNVYDSGFSLSKRIWGDNKKVLDDIYTVVGKGIALNKSTYDIAKDLEKYVRPNAKKNWDWSKVYPRTNKQVDYNAQRLARTLSNHAFQQAFVMTTEHNPFVECYRWENGNNHVCQLCIDRAENDEYGLGAGLFPKDKLPLDHPNGRCVCTAVIKKSDAEIRDAIVNWRNSPTGTYTDLDEFSNSLRYRIR